MRVRATMLRTTMPHVASLPALLAAAALVTACNLDAGAGAAGRDGGAGGEGATGPDATSSVGASSSAGATGGAGGAASTGASTTGSGAGSAASSSAASGSSSSGGGCLYPMDAIGVSVGKTVPSIAWQGYAENGAPLGSISIQSYFDCNGDEGINAVLLLQAATWCSSCQLEATSLEAQAAAWASSGIRVLTLMVEDQSTDPASTDTALAWRDAFGLDSVAVAADPNFTFAHPGFNGFPVSIVVNPRTMKIVSIEEGYTGDYSVLEQLAQQNAN